MRATERKVARDTENENVEQLRVRNVMLEGKRHKL